MKTKLLLGLALVLCGGILMLTGGCTTAKSEKTDMKISELQRRVESLEAVSSALTAELVEQQGKYVVKQGDTLTLIAKRFNLRVEDIFRMNPDLSAQLTKNWKPGIVIIVREQEPTQSPQSYAAQIRALCPAGWLTSISNDVIVLRRENSVWIMGKISNPPRMPDETEAAYFQRCGQQIRYELRLRFVPLLTQQEFEKLQTARQQAAAALKRGGSGKIEYDGLQKEFENCQVPQFFTEKDSIYVEHWADITNNVNTTGYHLEPEFIDVYPPETVTEIKSLATSLKKVFQTCATDKP
jgi:LysM repeat protein